MNKSIINSLVFVSFIVGGCAQVPSVNDPLKARFNSLKTTLTTDNVREVAYQYYAPELIGDNYHPEPDEVWQLMLWTDLPHEKAYFESIQGNIGCLTIIGYAKDGEPTALKYRYINRDNTWLIDLQEIAYLETEENYPAQVTCPE